MTGMASIKAFARDTCGQLLSLGGVTAPGVRMRQRLSIITFHRVLTEAQRKLYPLPGLAVTPQELDAHLKFATRHFRCMPLSMAMDVWAQDQSDAPPLLAITFDDGQLDNYVNALPVLEHNRVKASFYIPSQILEHPGPLWHDAMATAMGLLKIHPPQDGEGVNALLTRLHPAHGTSQPLDIESALETTKDWTAGQRADWIQQAQKLLPHPVLHAWDGFMSARQMKDLIVRGHEIGSHSHSHPLLPQCTDEELVAEISGSREKLESALDAPVNTFCYPNGSTDSRSVEQVRRAGYRAAVTTRWGSNSVGHDPFQLSRFDMHARHAQDRKGRFSGPRLAWRMSGLYPGLTGTRHDACRGASTP